MTKLDENLFDLIDQTLVQQPQLDNQAAPNSPIDTELANQILDIIKNTVDITTQCNTFKQYASQVGKSDMIDKIDFISDKVTSVVGDLKELLVIVQPNANNM